MSYFHETLILLEEIIEPPLFLPKFHQGLDTIDLMLEIDDDNFITYNDTRNHESKDFIDLNSLMSRQDVFNFLYSWPALGLLSYQHPNFRLPIKINYHTWDDKNIQAISVGFHGSDVQEKKI